MISEEECGGKEEASKNRRRGREKVAGGKGVNHYSLWEGCTSG